MHRILEKFLFLGLFVPLMASCTSEGPMFSGDLIFVEGLPASIRPEYSPLSPQKTAKATLMGRFF